MPGDPKWLQNRINIAPVRVSAAVRPLFGLLGRRRGHFGRRSAFVGRCWVCYTHNNLPQKNYKKIYQKPVTLKKTIWFQFINPKSIIVGLTSISLFIDTQNNYLRDSIILTSVWFCMAVGSQTAWCLMGKYMRKFATSDKFIKNFNYTMSFLLIVCVILFYV